MSTDNYCCDEHTCHRKSPLNIVYGELSGRVFVVTRRRVVRDRGDGTATFAAVERHDVTEQFQDFLANNAEAILDMLAEATGPPSASRALKRAGRKIARTVMPE